jgi:opacity protein-like surface antigen
MEFMTVGMGRPAVIGEGPGDVGSELVASRNGGGAPARKPARPPGQTPEVEETKMRKLGIVVTALACLTIMAFAAQAATAPVGEEKGNIGFGIGGGLTMPMGKLADEDEANMKMGFDVDGYFDYFITKEIALGLDASYGQMANQDNSDLKAKTTQFGIHGKYLIPTNGPIVPYLQLGFGMYNRKIEYKPEGLASLSVSDTKPGVNAGVGVGYKVNDMVGIGLSGAYHYSIGEMEDEGVTVLDDWNYIAFNLGIQFHIKPAK